MDTNDVLLLGLLGVGAYFLISKMVPTAAPMMMPPAGPVFTPTSSYRLPSTSVITPANVGAVGAAGNLPYSLPAYYPGVLAPPPAPSAPVYVETPVSLPVYALTGAGLGVPTGTDVVIDTSARDPMPAA